MKINVIKRKASSYKNLSVEQIEVGNPQTLIQLLKNIMAYQIETLHCKEKIIDNQNINDQAKAGKVSFGAIGEKPEIETMIETLIQDFEDGLLRIYYNDEEEKDLYKKIEVQDNDTIVFIKLIMLTGRLW